MRKTAVDLIVRDVKNLFHRDVILKDDFEDFLRLMSAASIDRETDNTKGLKPSISSGRLKVKNAMRV